MMEIKIARRKRSSINLLILFLLSGCASQIEVLTPSSMFIYPEATGETAKGTLTVHSLYGSILGINFSETSAEASVETTKSEKSLAATGLFGFGEKVDFYARAGTNAPHLLGAKIQVYGENFENTHSNNISVSINLGYGQNSYIGSGNENFGIQLSNADYTFDRIHTTAQIGFLAGWRYEKYILFYGGYSKIIDTVNGFIEFSGSPIDGEAIALQGNHTQITTGWLYEFDPYKLTAEYSLQQMSWEGDTQTNIQTFNLGIGFDY